MLSLCRALVAPVAAAASLALLPTVGVAAPTAPVMKRFDTADRTNGLIAAHDFYLGWTSSDGGATAWFNRNQAQTIDDGPDWVTSYLPREWHPNTWLYKKGTSFLKSENLHTNPATSSLFVKISGTNQNAAVNYECGPSTGCTQALLDLTTVEGQNFWLFGAETNSDGSIGALRSEPPTVACQQPSNWAIHKYDGVLYRLACGYEGVWVDDAHVDLKTSR